MPMPGRILGRLQRARRMTAMQSCYEMRQWYDNLGTGIVSSILWREAWRKLGKDLREKLCDVNWLSGGASTKRRPTAEAHSPSGYSEIAG